MTRPFADDEVVKVQFKSIMDVLERIEEQTKATNGRVRSLEAWRNYMLGAFGLFSLLLGTAPLWLTHFS